MSSYSSRSPITFTLANMPDMLALTSPPDIYDVNLFLFKNPWLGPIDRNPPTPPDGNQPNDITKLSLKTMSDYILKYGITLDDPDLTPITVTSDQQFNSISYIGEIEPPYRTDPSSQTLNRPATIRDMMNMLNDIVTTPISEWLTEPSSYAFETINDIVPDYLVTLDSTLTTYKLKNITKSDYSEVYVTDFIYVGDAPGYVSTVPDGLLDPTTMTILAAHQHSNNIVDEKGNSVFKLQNEKPQMRSDRTGGTQSMILSASDTMSVRSYSNDSIRSHDMYVTLAGKTSISGKGSNTTVDDNVENYIGANNINAECQKNDATAAHYIPSLNKISVRYKARCYRVFKKD